MAKHGPLGISIVLLTLCTPLAAQVVFQDATAESGLHFRHRSAKTPRKYLPETMSGGVAIFDYDRDGWMDVFFVNGAQLSYPHPQGEEPDKSQPEFWNRLYRNQGDGAFEDVTEKAGLQGRGYGMGAAVGDIDNDGFPDLVVTQAATGDVPSITLYRNEEGRRFTDITQESGIQATGWATSAAFVDYDRDGALDLFVARYLDWGFDVDHGCGLETPAGRTYCHPDLYAPVSNYLFHNEGGETFRDVSEETGIAGYFGKALGVAVADFVDDGLVDIAVANDSHPQYLFRNLGDSKFEEEAILAGLAYDGSGGEFAGMGIAAGDVDGDGLVDVLTTTLSQQRYAFFQNLGEGLFEYRTDSSGLGLITRLLAGWGLVIADFDHDGSSEVFLANGHVMDNIERSQPHVRYLQPPSLLRYGEGQFVDVSGSAGKLFSTPRAGRGVAAGDLDNDGDLDLVVSNLDQPAYFARNESKSENWIGFKLRGSRSGRDAIGSQITVTLADGSKRFGTVTRSGSYLSSRDPRVLLAVGGASKIDGVQVTWPSGESQQLGSLSLQQIHVVEEPR